MSLILAIKNSMQNPYPPPAEKEFLARYKVRAEIGANSEFTGNGLTQSRERSTQYRVVETLILESNPPPISKISNIKTIELKPRGVTYMNQKLIAQHLGLIEPDSLEANEKFLFEVHYEMYPEKIYVF